jgi:alpha-glucosidase
MHVRIHIIFLAAWIAAALAMAQTDSVKVSSPDSLIELRFSAAPDGGQLFYDVTYRGRPVLERSALGLDIQDQPVLGDHVRIVAQRRGKIGETWQAPAGKANPIRNECNTLSLDLHETRRPNRLFTVDARVYDDGVAFRYAIPDQEMLKVVRLVNEKTQFVMAADATTWPLVLKDFHTSWEDNYRTVALSGIHGDSLVAMPLLLELPGVAFVAITEADIDNYSGMYLMHSEARPRALEARLAPRVDEPGVAVIGPSPMASPWRVLMIGPSPGRLIESNIVENLNPPSAIADTSWIKPGKAAWDWWSGPFDEGVKFKPGKNTATAKHYVDFAAQAGFEYFMLDGGWSAPGHGPNDSGGDITRARPEINMPELLDYAKSKNVRLWVWAHWTDVARQMDEAFPLYEKWGIAGVKIDFMDRDDQWMVDFYRRVARKAAEHHLLIDFHGAFKPDGLSRTWPNVLTREGVLGLEYNKWSARVTPDHNVMLAFTRMLAGPMDYTPGGFHNVTRAAFRPQNDQPMVMGTRAHQTALFVVFLSPFEMVSDYPEAYQGQKELAFLSSVPTTWDETRVLNGNVGDYITIARRHGKEWYVGSIAGWHGAEFDLPLEFLGPGQYTAESWRDAPDAAENPTHTVTEQAKVNRSTVLKARLVSGGGAAIRIRPVE